MMIFLCSDERWRDLGLFSCLRLKFMVIGCFLFVKFFVMFDLSFWIIF